MSFFTQPIEETAFNHIVKNTYNEFFNEVAGNLRSNENATISPVELANNECSIDKLLFKVNYSDQVHALGNKYHINKKNRVTDANSFYNADNFEMNKIEASMTIEECLPIIKNIREELGENMFGAILVRSDGSRRGEAGQVNPLNPLVATAIKEMMDREEKPNILKRLFNIVIYTFKSTTMIKEMKKDDPQKDYKDDIQKIMISSHLSAKVSTVYSNPRRLSQTSMDFQVVYKDENGNTLRNGVGRYFMVPVQIANCRGLMYPSYGAVLFEDRQVKNLSPFFSANAGTPSVNEGAWSNVCTGSLNSSTDRGKISLNHSNNTSPLNRQNIRKGAIKYAHAAIDISLQLLLNETIEVAGPEPERPTFGQFKESHPDATIAEYIEHIRKQNEKELPTW